MNAFRGIILGTLCGILLWLLSVLALWAVFFRSLPPAFSHPEMTLHEKRVVKQSIRRHGDWPITREGYEGRYFMHIKGKRVAL